MPGPGNDILYDFRQVTENHVQATVDLAADVAAGLVPRPDFVVWPENSTATDPWRDPQTNAGILRATEAIGVPVLVGALVDGPPGAVLNQGIVWDPVTGAGERYTKRHPVAYGEFIPFRGTALELSFGDLARIQRLSNLLRRRLRGRDLRPGRARGAAGERADLQRHLHLLRPGAAAVRHDAAARPGGGRLRRERPCRSAATPVRQGGGLRPPNPVTGAQAPLHPLRGSHSSGSEG